MDKKCTLVIVAAAYLLALFAGPAHACKAWFAEGRHEQVVKYTFTFALPADRIPCGRNSVLREVELGDVMGEEFMAMQNAAMDLGDTTKGEEVKKEEEKEDKEEKKEPAVLYYNYKSLSWVIARQLPTCLRYVVEDRKVVLNTTHVIGGKIQELNGVTLWKDTEDRDIFMSFMCIDFDDDEIMGGGEGLSGATEEHKEKEEKPKQEEQKETEKKTTQEAKEKTTQEAEEKTTRTEKKTTQTEEKTTQETLEKTTQEAEEKTTQEAEEKTTQEAEGKTIQEEEKKTTQEEETTTQESEEKPTQETEGKKDEL